MRMIAEAASKHLGQPVIVDNKPGAAGTLGPATMAAGAKPDGYIIAQMPVTVHRLPLMQKTSWDSLKDFTYVVHLTGYSFGITALADGPYKTWPDVVAYAKANPGKVAYGSSGAGSTLHIGMERIAQQAGITLTHVPFKGGIEAATAVLGGHVALSAAELGGSGLVASGKLRPLAAWSDKRSPNYPDVPTLKDLGYAFAYDSPFGLAGPKGIPPAIVAKLHDAFKAALDDPKVLDLMAKNDMAPRYMDSAKYAAFVGEIIENERAGLATMGLLKKE
jgi:tripartite-type tricarboxylate transporter receptor subunit TctC